MPVKVKTTRYGFSKKAGGWDSPGDSNTDKRIGGWGNKLTDQACALTESARAALNATHLAMIRLTWDNGRTRIVRYEDIAPEADKRVDIFLPYADDPTIPDYGYAEVIPSAALTIPASATIKGIPAMNLLAAKAPKASIRAPKKKTATKKKKAKAKPVPKKAKKR